MPLPQSRDRTRRTPVRAWTRLGALVASLLAALALAAPATAVEPSYVAMGDSYTAGPVIPVQIPPFGCLKSNNNYPHLAAPHLKPDVFRDISCSGAKTDHTTRQQNVNPGPNPSQFSALDSNTRIVSFTFGGNDIGFSEIQDHCFTADPRGTPCQDHYVDESTGRDELSERIKATAPKIAAVIQGIHELSPKADVYVVNYLAIFPEGDRREDYIHCWPQMPVAWDDIPYLRAKQKELNAMLAAQAAANNANLVDAYSASEGHDACQPPAIRWVEPAVPASPAAPVHPNLFGMQGTKDALLKAVNSE